MTDNNTESLYRGIKKYLSNKKIIDYYAKTTKMRGKEFDTKSTIKEVENLLDRQ